MFKKKFIKVASKLIDIAEDLLKLATSGVTIEEWLRLAKDTPSLIIPLEVFEDFTKEEAVEKPISEWHEVLKRKRKVWNVPINKEIANFIFRKIVKDGLPGITVMGGYIPPKWFSIVGGRWLGNWRVDTLFIVCVPNDTGHYGGYTDGRNLCIDYLVFSEDVAKLCHLYRAHKDINKYIFYILEGKDYCEPYDEFVNKFCF